MLFVGDDWAEDHHDIEVQDEHGRRVARARLPEGIAGLSRLHELIAEHLTAGGAAGAEGGPGHRPRPALTPPPPHDGEAEAEAGFVAPKVMIGIETDRGT